MRDIQEQATRLLRRLELLARTFLSLRAKRSNLARKEDWLKKYTIILDLNYPEDGYTVRVPALPGCITYGRTKEEALERAREAIEGFIEGLQKAGEPVPEEVTPAQLGTVII